MTTAQAFLISQILLIATPIILIAWDTYVYRRFGHNATESHAMYQWSLKYKYFALFIMLLAAFLCWHFFVG